MAGFVRGPAGQESGRPSLVRPTAGHIVAATFLSLLAAGVYSTTVWGVMIGSSDYADHLDFARSFYASGQPPVPHFLFHALVAALIATGLVHSFAAAGHLAIVACYLAIPLLLYGFLWTLFRNSGVGRPSILFLAGLATFLAQPITLNHAYAVGFFWPEPYHSPTFIMLKPFAIAGFAGAAWYLSHGGGGDVRLTALFTLATAAGALSKPSFLICVLPAVTILAIYRLARRLPFSVAGLLVGLYVPAAVVLAWQAWVTYSGHGTGEYQDSIEWAPFKFMSLLATHLAAKFLLSIAFPLAVTMAYWRQARRDVILQLSWLCFLFGAVYSYSLVERINWAAGNFTWSGDIAAFTLFLGSVAFWLRWIPSQHSENGHPQWAFWLCGAVLALHAISGARIDWFYFAHYGCAPNYQGGFVCGG